MATPHLSIGVALADAGWHPAAWRADGQATDVFSPSAWARWAEIAETGGLDYLTIDDGFGLQVDDDRTDEVRGRLDASLIASYLAPRTSRIGLIPAVTTTHTEPFHVATAIATLDHLSGGRAGWQPRVSARGDEAALIGRREIAQPTHLDSPEGHALLRALFGEAGDAVEVARRLWDSWEDDAEIRDVVTDRFLDADRLHTIDFVGEWFSVRGPSITPRSPQGQPVVAALAHITAAYEFAATSADVVFVTPTSKPDADAVLAEVRDAEVRTTRAGEPLRIVADILTVLDAAEHGTGGERLARLDALGRPLRSDAYVYAGPASELADVIASVASQGYQGVRLRPAVHEVDLPAIVDDVLPVLQERGLHEPARPDTLRARLGLSTTVKNRYATVAG